MTKWKLFQECKADSMLGNTLMYLNNVIICKEKGLAIISADAARTFEKIQDLSLIKTNFRRGLEEYFLNLIKHLAYHILLFS